MSSTNQEVPHYHEKPPPYTPTVHQHGTAGGKPVYIQGPRPTPIPNPYYVNTSNEAMHQRIVITQAANTQYVIPVTGNVYREGICPACRTGVLINRFTFLGMMLAIFLFPLGIICCMMMQEKKCSYCGLTYN